jgi:Undecaprenyl-phosphate glucose phosphotransferase
MNFARRTPSIQTTAEAARDQWSGPGFHVADMRVAVREAPSSGDAGPQGRPPEDHPRISQPLILAMLLLLDVMNFIASGALAFLAAQPNMHAGFEPLVWGLVTVTVIGLTVLKMRWCYTIRALGDFPRQVVSLAFAFCLALAIWDAGSILAGGADAGFLRQWTLLWFAWGWGGGAFFRSVFAVAVRQWSRQGQLARRTVVVGGGEQAMATIRRLEQSGRGALQILGIFDDRDRSRLPADMGKYQLLGAFSELEAFCRERKVDLLIVAFPSSAETRILYILNKLWTLPVDIRISALGGKLKLRDRAYNYIGGVPFLPVFDKPMSDWSIAMKSVFDRVVALAGVILFSPVLALVALGVKLTSPGPVFFVQSRYGFNNEQFFVFKFRSMYAEKCDPKASRLVTRNDPRVTKFGAFIRRTSLDELPQLFNVLKGDLSLVGPRPHAVKGKAAGMVYENVVEGYFARHRVKPGITGWAQINGWRGETDTVEKIEQRVAHDLYYIENWSIWFDVKILAMTPISVLFGKNAF